MPCRRPLQAAYIPGQKPLVYPRGRRPNPLAAPYQAIELPCGQCRGCKLEHSRRWGARIAHEAAWLWEEHNLLSSFITLTYDEKNLPMYGSLVPKHLQDFFKRFRGRIHPNQIRYYASGEYGTKCPQHELHNCPICGPIQRPHYHAIVLGWCFPDRNYVGERNGLSVYESPLLNQLWNKGFHEIGSCSFESAAYCARYVMKKQTGKPVQEGHYTRYDPWMNTWNEVEPEFANMSRRPGIGRHWAIKYMDDLYPKDELPIPGRGVYGKPPPYYDHVYLQETGDDLTDVKQQRRDAFNQSIEHGPTLESRAAVQDAKLAKLQRKL